MATFPLSYYHNQYDSPYLKEHNAYYPLSPSNECIITPNFTSSQYHTHYRPNLQSYMKEGNRTMKTDLFNSNNRSSSVYTYPYNYSKDYIVLQQNERKKKQEYSHYLKKQIEEKQYQRASEAKRLQIEKERDEERYKAFNSQSRSTYNCNANSQSLNKMSLNGMNIVEKSTSRNANDCSNSIIAYAALKGTDRSGSIPNHSQIAYRTPKLPLPLIENLNNELLFSRCNNKAQSSLPESLARIDLSVLKYHSKYETPDEADDVHKGGLNSHIKSDGKIGQKAEEKAFSSRKDNLRSSLQGTSTLVQVDDGKGVSIVDGFLKVWEDEEKEKKEKIQAAPDKNGDEQKLKAVKNEETTCRNSSLKQSGAIKEAPYKDSRAYFSTKDIQDEIKQKDRLSNPIKLTHLHGEDIAMNKKYNKAIDFQNNIPLPHIEPNTKNDSQEKNYAFLIREIENYRANYITGRDSVIDNVNDTIFKGGSHYSLKPLQPKELNHSIHKPQSKEEYPQGIKPYAFKEEEGAFPSSMQQTKTVDSTHEEEKAKYSFRESIKTIQKEAKRPLYAKEDSSKSFEAINKADDQHKEIKTDSDDLCNIRYDSDTDSEKNTFVIKQNDEGEEKGGNEPEDITCNFLGDDEELKGNSQHSNPLLINSKETSNKEDIKESQHETSKFRSQIDFFNQSGNESLVIKKSQLHKVNPELISFGQPIQNNEMKNSTVSSIDNSKTFVTTIKEVSPLGMINQTSSAGTSNKKRVEESIDVHDSFTSKIIKGIDNFHLNGKTTSPQ